MRHADRTALAAARAGALLLALLALAACGGTGADPVPPLPVLPEFDPADFAAATSNAWFPLVPGTTFRYAKDTDEGLEETVVEVLDETKVILGVVCRVVLATETLEGEVVEITRDWYAEDGDGNVWYLGEESEEYEGGMLVGTDGSWEAGVDGAMPGILLPAAPAVGLSWSQEDAPGVAEDQARVVALAVPAAVPYGAFPACLETEDSTPLEPGVLEWKFYAPGVGLLLEVDEDGGRNELLAVTGP